MRCFTPSLALTSLITISFALAACGRGGGTDDGSANAEGGDVQGTVRSDGSSTVFPLAEAVSEEFQLANPGVRVTLGRSGTGGGFAKFVRGEIDISNASRPISTEEVEQAEAGGVPFVELPVAYDGLAIVVNPQNNWVECLTVDELRAMWAPGSTVNSWGGVRSGFPSRPLRLYGAGTDSGTFDYFTKAIVGEEGESRTDYTASEDDNVLVQGVAGDPSALAYIPLAYYQNNRDRLRLVPVDDGDASNGAGCVQPTAQTVQNGTYQPLSRPEFIYVSAERASDPAVQAYVRFFLENAAALAPEVGAVPLGEAAYTAARERFDRGTAGSVFSGGSQVGVRLEDLLRMEAAPADTAVAPEAR